MSQQIVQPAEGFVGVKDGNPWCLPLFAPGTNFLTTLPEGIVCYFLLYQTLTYEMITVWNFPYFVY